MLASGCRPALRTSNTAIDRRWTVGRLWLHLHPAEVWPPNHADDRGFAKRLYAWFAENEASLKRQAWFMETLPLFEAPRFSFAFKHSRRCSNNDPNGCKMHWLCTRLALPALAGQLPETGNLLVEQEDVWRLEGTFLLPMKSGKLSCAMPRLFAAVGITRSRRPPSASFTTG